MNCFSFCTYKIIFIFLLLKDTFCWYRNLGRISYWSQYIEDIVSLPSHIVSEDKLLPSLFLLFYIKCPVFSSFLYNFFSLSLWVLNNLTMVCAMVQFSSCILCLGFVELPESVGLQCTPNMKNYYFFNFFFLFCPLTPVLQILQLHLHEAT